MRNLLISIFITCIFLISACDIAFAQKAVQSKAMLEIREIQTHIFETPDTKKVTKAVINTLQDNGFIIQAIEPDLGFIRAKKEVKLKRTLKGRVVKYSLLQTLDAVSLVCGFNPQTAWDMYEHSMQLKNELAPHTVIFDSNVSIQRLGKRTKVRFSVIEKVLENGDGYTTVKSSPRKVARHYEPEVYQEFFNQVDKNLFLEKNL